MAKFQSLSPEATSTKACLTFSSRSQDSQSGKDSAVDVSSRSKSSGSRRSRTSTRARARGGKSLLSLLALSLVLVLIAGGIGGGSLKDMGCIVTTNAQKTKTDSEEGGQECNERDTSTTKMGGDSQILKFPSTEELSLQVGEMVLKVVEEAAGKDKFLIALSGGSLPKLLAKGLLQYADKIDFSKWHVFFADERYVEHDHPDSNLLACRKEFLEKIPGIIPEHVYGIDVSVPVEQAAEKYQEILVKVSGSALPKFDLIMLGMGPDGHTCSLFPNHPLLGEMEKIVAPIKDSPKPPPQRITLTYPVLNNAANVFFLAAGGSKVDVIPLTAGLSIEDLAKLGDDSLPAARVRPAGGRLVWFIDDAAGAKL